MESVISQILYSVYWTKETRTTLYQFLTSVSFIAYNLHKDTAFLLSEEDLKSCTHIPSDILLCSLNMPIYDLKMKQSICDIKIINHAHLCKSVKSSCEERWIKLHRPNTWLYTCCPECQVRIICANGVTMTHLINNGIITLGQGCTLKGDTFSIYAHNNFFSNLNIHHHIEVPEVSMLNRIMKTSIPDNISMVEDHQVIWDQLRAQIDEVKEQSSTDLSIHDVHHYTVLYISVAAVIILGGVVVYLIRSRRAAARQQRRRPPRARRLLAGPATVAPVDPAPVASHQARSVLKCSEVFTVSGVDKATSPESM
ncbi:hypothetical protein HW555_012666 [Spodoptera exigua]|uniref:Iris-A n=1 Tax=Spodoptera exigua TaxID=7107 RepID=A0A835KYV0_SPOEX|nr:hypothetical protein HW555_012666 [Spodoptera exigua]